MAASSAVMYPPSRTSTALLVVVATSLACEPHTNSTASSRPSDRGIASGASNLHPADTPIDRKAPFNWGPRFISRPATDIAEFGSKPVHGKHCGAGCDEFSSRFFGPKEFELLGDGCGGSLTADEPPCAKFSVDPLTADDNATVVRVTPLKPFGPKQTWVFPATELGAPRLRALVGSYAEMLGAAPLN